jgi:aquaporin Z
MDKTPFFKTHFMKQSKQEQTGTFRKYVVEFIGTFFLVITICMTINSEPGWISSLGAGFILVAITYAGFQISGGHFNPAVSIASYLRGKLDAGDLLPYIIAQFLGGTLAAMLAGYLLISMDATLPTTIELKIVPSLIAELLGTILFVYVFLNVTTAKKTKGNEFYGVAIGFAFIACLYAFGSITGGAFNPAVALGLAMADCTSWSSIWIFFVANFVGGALAAFISQYVNGPNAEIE